MPTFTTKDYPALFYKDWCNGLPVIFSHDRLLNSDACKHIDTYAYHGDDDQIVPIDFTAKRVAEIVQDSTLNIYHGAPHGCPMTYKDKINANLLVFIQPLNNAQQKIA